MGAGRFHHGALHVSTEALDGQTKYALHFLHFRSLCVGHEGRSVGYNLQSSL